MRIRFPAASAPVRRVVALLAAGLLATFALDTGSRLARRAATPDVHASATAMQDSLVNARDLLKKRDHAGARARALDLLAQAERSPGPGSLETAEVLDFLVEVTRAAGAVAAPEARAYAERAVQIKEQLLSADDLRLAVSLIQLADLRQRGGEFPQARPLVERALAIRTRALGHENLLVASTFDNLGIVRRQMAAYADAKQCFESSLRIRRRLLGFDDPEVARSLHYLGIVQEDLGDYAAALQSYERALAIREKRLPADDPRVAETLSNLAGLHFTCGRYGEARPLYERALALREARGDQNRLAETLNNLSEFLQASGDYAAARAHCERALEIRRRIAGADSWLVAASLLALADIHQDMGDYAVALSCYEEALRVYEMSLGPEHPEVALCVGGLAELLRSTGDTAEAGRLCERALAIQVKSVGPNHSRVGKSMHRLGRALLEAGDCAAALPLLQKALAIQEKALSAQHEEVGTTLADLATALAKTGATGEARQTFARARPVLERALGPQHPDVAACLVGEGDFFVAQGELKAARANYARAGRIYESAYGSIDPALGLALCKQAKLDARAGEVRAAFERALRGEAIGRETLELTARTLPERRALRYSATRASGLGLALSLLVDAGDRIEGASARAWDACIRSRTLVLDEMASRNRALEGSADPDMSQLAAALLAARERLSKLTVLGVGESTVEDYRMLVAAARREKERAERAFAERSAAFRHEQARSRAGLAEVTAALPPRSALVAFVRFDREALEESLRTRDHRTPWYLAFVLAPGARQPSAVSLGSATSIEGAVSRWMAAVAEGGWHSGRSTEEAEQSYRHAGTALRQRIWDPVAPLLGTAERVFMVPDAAVHLVSLAALPVGEGQYLAETGPILHYLSAEHDLLPSESASPEGRGLLALGGCDFDAPAAPAVAGPTARATASAPVVDATATLHVLRGGAVLGREFETHRFEPLPASAQEVAEIANLWKRAQQQQALHGSEPPGAPARTAGPCMLLVGRAASEAAFKHNAPGKRVLHLATHGFFLGGSAPATGQGDRGIKSVAVAKPSLQASDAGENPLVLSGLVLAGANNRARAGPGEEDGILTAEEIAALDLQDVEWVVLSACNTGVGETRAGEGVFGLRRAFEVAGAGTLVMSLWPVEDEGARQWMRALYQARLEDGSSTSDAVQAALRAALQWSRQNRHSGHPVYWAGFVAAGDWR